MHRSRETPAMIERVLSAFAAQLTPEQAQTAASDLQQKAEATREQTLGELLAESAESLSLPAAVRNLPDVTSTGESTEMALWLLTSAAAELTPAQLEAAAADLRQQAAAEQDPAMKEFLADSAETISLLTLETGTEPPPQPV